MTYNEIRNITGIRDDDALNAACECERKDDLAEKIAHDIVTAHGYDRGLYNGHVFSFAKVCEVMKKYSFVYITPDADDVENEIHRFWNEETDDEITIVPVHYYPKLDKFKFLKLEQL